MQLSGGTVPVNYRVLWLPPLLLFSAFLFDKLFLIGDFEKTYLTTASFLNFDHKERLTDELEEYLKKENRKKTLVLMGNSRTLSFHNDYIEENHPEWILFNFSVPGGTTDYFAYLLEKFERRNISPDYILFAVTPQGMNQAAAISLDEVLIYGLPFSFMTRHFYRFSMNDLSNYVAKKLFVVYKYRPKLDVIRFRLKGNNLQLFDHFIEAVNTRLDKERGSVPYQNMKENSVDPVLLEKNAQSIWKDFFVPFRLSEGQYAFTEDCLRLAGKVGSDAGLLWVRVSPNLRKRIETEKVAYQSKRSEKTTILQAWKPVMIKLANQYEADFFDTNFEPGMDCDDFTDASHMFTTCYNPMIDYLITRIENRVVMQ